jgi:hypothetical protein
MAASDSIILIIMVLIECKRKAGKRGMEIRYTKQGDGYTKRADRIGRNKMQDTRDK